MNRFWLPVVLLVVLLLAGCAGGTASSEQDKGEGLAKEAAREAGAGEDIAAGKSAGAANSALEPIASSEQPATATGAGEEHAPGADEPAPKSTGLAERQVTLWVTRDYAFEQVYGGKAALIPDDSVMDIMQAGNLEVTTQYGGGFVESINGLASGYTGKDKETRDWFFYINGIIASVGAVDYRPAGGDVIWWDYHDWGRAIFTPALIGAFPEPFLGGYKGDNPGTLVLAAAGYEEQGNELAECLRHWGVENVEVRPYCREKVAHRDRITLVVGLWEQFADQRFWQGAQKNRQKTGLFVEFNRDYIAALNMSGEIVERHSEDAGAIVATGAGMGDPTPLWLVTGLDRAGLDGAVDIITGNPGAIKQRFGAVVAGGKVIGVPVAN
ncbi:MAG: DUF4430 domain-containing protein [Firmicutes bacterium]|nr:DUF4430 domain-containing protein [Bacillota bacterium]